MGCLSSKPAIDDAPAKPAEPVPEAKVEPVAPTPEAVAVAAPEPAPKVEPPKVEETKPPPSPPKTEKSQEELEAEKALGNAFELFATIDTSKSGSVDVDTLAVAMEKLPVLGTRLCANLGVVMDATSPDADATPEFFKSLSVKILAACSEELDAPGSMKPHELERLVSVKYMSMPKLEVYAKVPDFAERDREHQLKGAAARAEIRAEDDGGFVGLIDTDEAKEIAHRSTTKQRIENEMKQFAESDPERFGDGAAYSVSGSPELKKKREAYLKKIEQELKEEGMLNKVGEDWTGLTPEEAAKQIETIKLGGVEVEIEGETERRQKQMPERLAKRLESDTEAGRKPPAYWENRQTNAAA